MNSFDHSLKYLVGHEPADFISFGLGGVPVEILGPLPTALPARGRDLDSAYLVSVEGDVLVSHLEYHRRHQALEELASTSPRPRCASSAAKAGPCCPTSRIFPRR